MRKSFTSYACKYWRRMAVRSAFIWSFHIFVINLLLSFHGRAEDDHQNCIHVPVFFNTDGIYEKFVFNSAMKFYARRESENRNKSFNDFELIMHFSRIQSRNESLASLIQKVSNMTSSIRGAIFVDMTKNSLTYSALFDSVSIPSLGLFRSQNGIPITQVR